MRSTTILLAVIIFILNGCASIKVTKVTSNDNKTEGQRYSLPKPIIQVLPQADDTILVNVLMLPDSDNTYAVAASSHLSTYSYQITVNQNGTLAAIEFKQDTSMVGQQLAASAASAATQVSNIRNANQLALQTAVNTAQNNVDTAQAAYDKAVAQATADTNNGVTGTPLQTDLAARDAALAALQDAKAVLIRVRSTAQVGASTATAGTPLAATPLTPTASAAGGFGPQTWTNSSEYELPQALGGVLYVVNETLTDDIPSITLKAAALKGATQPQFETANLASGVPALQPSSQTVSSTTSSFSVIFSRPVVSVDDCRIFTTSNTNVTSDAKCSFADSSGHDRSSVTVTMPTKAKLTAGTYNLRVAFSYSPAPGMSNIPTEKVVSFTVQP
ncbi:hypothetical protein GMSM_44300 [Geomonas sp. Red276]